MRKTKNNNYQFKLFQVMPKNIMTCINEFTTPDDLSSLQQTAHEVSEILPPQSAWQWENALKKEFRRTDDWLACKEVYINQPEARKYLSLQRRCKLYLSSAYSKKTSHNNTISEHIEFQMKSWVSEHGEIQLALVEEQLNSVLTSRSLRCNKGKTQQLAFLISSGILVYEDVAALDQARYDMIDNEAILLAMFGLVTLEETFRINREARMKLVRFIQSNNQNLSSCSIPERSRIIENVIKASELDEYINNFDASLFFAVVFVLLGLAVSLIYPSLIVAAILDSAVRLFAITFAVMIAAVSCALGLAILKNCSEFALFSPIGLFVMPIVIVVCLVSGIVNSLRSKILIFESKNILTNAKERVSAKSESSGIKSERNKLFSECRDLQPDRDQSVSSKLSHRYE